MQDVSSDDADEIHTDTVTGGFIIDFNVAVPFLEVASPPAARRRNQNNPRRA
jgi:hypothetical protein